MELAGISPRCSGSLRLQSWVVHRYGLVSAYPHQDLPVKSQLFNCLLNKKEAHSIRCALSVLALPIFPGRLQPSIVGRGELNFRVRDGNGWTLTLINTNYLLRDNTLKTEQRYFRDGKAIACILLVGQALGRLVRISCIHYCTSTFRLSTR